MSRDGWQRGQKVWNNLVLVGESGCGKTELALYLAARIAAAEEASAVREEASAAAENTFPAAGMVPAVEKAPAAENTFMAAEMIPAAEMAPAAREEESRGSFMGRKEKRKVCLIDMDQTKGMFRSRDFAGKAGFEKVDFLCGEHFMDMPVVPPGIVERLTDPASVNVVDAGGNESGVVCLGQFSRWLHNRRTAVLYVVNPYRNFSGNLEDIRMVMDRIKAFGRLPEVSIVCNPNLGRGTVRGDVVSGFERLQAILAGGGMSAECVAAPDWVETEDGDFGGLPVLHITPAIRYP